MQGRSFTVEQGGQKVITAGITSTTSVQQSYPSATVTVYNSGTSTLANIFRDNLGTPLSNPTTASLAGTIFFFASNGSYDVQFSGGGLAIPVTIASVEFFDPAGASVFGSYIEMAEIMTPASVAAKARIWDDNSSHRLSLNQNAGSSDVVVGANTTDTLTNKTLDTAANTLKINGTQVSAISGTGAAVLANGATLSSPQITVPILSGSLGNVGAKLASTDGIIYVSTSGSDSNDGLSPGGAKATIQAAINALPSSGGIVQLLSGSFALNTSPTLKSNLAIKGIGCAQVDAVTGPTTITTTLTSGDLFYFNAVNDCHLEDLSIKNTAIAGANAAVRLTAAQRCIVRNVYISGLFARGVQLDSSLTAPASCIWNECHNVHTTGLAPLGIGLLLDSKDATAKVINGNYFKNFRASGGTGGYGIKLTNSNQAQVINENEIHASEVTASGGTAMRLDQGATAGLQVYSSNLEGSAVGFSKATANTVQFEGGNISANGTNSLADNVADSQPSFTIFNGTRIGGVVQNYGLTPAGGAYFDGIGLGAAAPSNNSINGSTGWTQKVAGSTVVTINSGSVVMAQPLNATIQSSILQGAASLNAVTLLNSQDELTAVTGNGADNILYTYTIPANTVASGKGVRVRFGINNTSGAAATLKFFLGNTSIFSVALAAAVNTIQGMFEIKNKAGVQNVQRVAGFVIEASSFIVNTIGVPATEDLTTAIAVKITGNEANPNTITPKMWIVELIQ